jgi:hypothetical protein
MMGLGRGSLLRPHNAPSGTLGRYVSASHPRWADSVELERL